MEILKSLANQITLSILVICSSSALKLPAQWTAPGSLEGETKEQYEKRMGWWEESRLGMFVCWGPVSLTGKEIGCARGGERNSWNGKGDACFVPDILSPLTVVASKVPVVSALGQTNTFFAEAKQLLGASGR